MANGMTAAPGKPSPESRGLAALGLKLGLSRLALWWEGAWRALWPPLGVMGAFLVLAFTGLLPTLPPALHLLILIGFAATLGYFGYRAAQGLIARLPCWQIALPGMTPWRRRCGRRIGTARWRSLTICAWRAPRQSWRLGTPGHCALPCWWRWSPALAWRGGRHQKGCSPRYCRPSQNRLRRPRPWQHGLKPGSRRPLIPARRRNS
ncbi:MAG: DUF4175 family protein [Acetobacteraceae bacterium]|nr:DUF4175 family protein [Acetobacteraceae bacterium]